MKILAVSQRVDVLADRGERRDALDQGWAAFLDACGFLPLLIPNRRVTAQRLLLQVGVAGVLLTGGNDLCAYDGNAPERDDTERFLLDYAGQNRLPAMGVCRGMQMIQHVDGVTLARVDGHVGTHEVTLTDRGRTVNSFHRWGTRATTPALEIWARSSDGIVEGVRDVRRRRIGLMWHPERVPVPEDEDVRLFREWFGDQG